MARRIDWASDTESVEELGMRDGANDTESKEEIVGENDEVLEDHTKDEVTVKEDWAKNAESFEGKGTEVIETVDWVSDTESIEEMVVKDRAIDTESKEEVIEEDDGILEDPTKEKVTVNRRSIVIGRGGYGAK